MLTRFAPSRRVAFCFILASSLLISMFLIGRQILDARWSLIDNWDYFNWLGPKLNLPLSDVWKTLINQTEVGNPQRRFRPSYYFLMIMEVSIWGPNVHLWYLARTLEFGFFIASIWWIVSRFVGLLLGAVLLVPMLALPFWGDIWARLGPSEIYGSFSLAVILFGSYAIFAEKNRRVRIAGAAAVALATIVLMGAKETFVPLAGMSVVIVAVAAWLRLIPRLLGAVLLVIMIAFAGFIGDIVQKIVSSGTDFNGDSIAFPMLERIAQDSFVQAISFWAPAHLVVLSLFALVVRLSGNNFRPWVSTASVATFIFAFLVAMYVSQAVAYRSEIPLNMRYDFPRLLFGPMNECLLACHSVYLIRQYLGSRAADIVSFGAALILIWVFIPQFDNIGALPAAAERNILTTTKFYNEMQAIVRAGKAAPQVPIILEAHEPLSWAYEPLLSLSTYLKAFGANNPVSVRVHPQGAPAGLMAEGFKSGLMAMQRGDTRFAPLSQSLAHATDGACISVGVNGPPESGCNGFGVKTE
jgi:hypothetical protein